MRGSHTACSLFSHAVEKEVNGVFPLQFPLELVGGVPLVADAVNLVSSLEHEVLLMCTFCTIR